MGDFVCIKNVFTLRRSGFCVCIKDVFTLRRSIYVTVSVRNQSNLGLTSHNQRLRNVLVKSTYN